MKQNLPKNLRDLLKNIKGAETKTWHWKWRWTREKSVFEKCKHGTTVWKFWELEYCRGEREIMLRGATASVLQAVLVFLPPCLRQVYRAYLSEQHSLFLFYIIIRPLQPTGWWEQLLIWNSGPKFDKPISVASLSLTNFSTFTPKLLTSRCKQGMKRY